MRQKYVVLKYADVYEGRGSMGEESAELLAHELDPETFFVIREQDVFAPQALFGYAHLIRSALEISSLPGRRIFSPEEEEHLIELSDALMDLGRRWTPEKIPD